MEKSKEILNYEFDFIKKTLFNQFEEEIIRNNLIPDKLEIKTNFHTYLINIRILLTKPVTKHSILFLHGHGDSPSWRSWIKLALIFFEINYNCYLIDLPGFGNSLVDNIEGVSFKIWQDDGAEFYKSMLELLGIKKVFVIARCGGAALTIRAISKYPELFESSHIFHNNMISSVPENFIVNFEKMGMKLFETWKEDPDHLKLSVGYKWYNMQRKKKAKFLFFMDINEEDFMTHYYKNPKYKPGKRRLKQFQIMEFSQKYIDFVVYFIEKNKFKEF